MTDYLAGGAQLVWVLYPKTRTVTVHHPDSPPQVIPSGGVLQGDAVLPGFAVCLRGLFP